MLILLKVPALLILFKVLLRLLEGDSGGSVNVEVGGVTLLLLRKVPPRWFSKLESPLCVTELRGRRMDLLELEARVKLLEPVPTTAATGRRTELDLGRRIEPKTLPVPLSAAAPAPEFFLSLGRVVLELRDSFLDKSPLLARRIMDFRRVEVCPAGGRWRPADKAEAGGGAGATE